ncbi:MAG: hypothetical protein KDK62_03535 [Chlamydiia bacterium]|nr:hypothetical protein [Chlamydiia bacterium]
MTEKNPEAKEEAKSLSAEDQKKLDRLKELQAELNHAFQDAKNYTGESKEDQAIFDKIKGILDEIAKLTKT